MPPERVTTIRSLINGEIHFSLDGLFVGVDLLEYLRDHRYQLVGGEAHLLALELLQELGGGHGPAGQVAADRLLRDASVAAGTDGLVTHGLDRTQS